MKLLAGALIALCLSTLHPTTAIAQFAAKNPLLAKYRNLNQSGFNESFAELKSYFAVELEENLKINSTQSKDPFMELKKTKESFAARRLLNVPEQTQKFVLSKIMKASLADKVVCLQILATIGNARARKEIIKYLGSSDPYLNHLALNLVVGSGKAIVPSLVSELENKPNSQRKLSLLSAMGRISDERVIPYIKPYLTDTSEAVRYQALQAMVARAPTEIRHEFKSILNQESSDKIKYFIIASIRKSNMREFSKYLFELLQHEEQKDLRVVLIRALGDLQYKSGTAYIKSLMDAKYHEEIRLAAKEVFKQLKH